MRKFKALVHTLRFKLFAAVLLIAIPLIAILIITNTYSVEVIRNQVTQSNRNMLSLYMNQIDDSLREVDNYLFSLSETESDMLIMNYPKERNKGIYTLTKLRLFRQLTSDVIYYPVVDTLFVYSGPNDELIMTQAFGSSLEERFHVRGQIHTMLREHASNVDYSQWQAWTDGIDYYLYHVVKSGDAYVGAWVNCANLMVPLNLIDLGDSGLALFTSSEHEPLTKAPLIADEGIDLTLPEDSYAITGKNDHYLVMGERSSRGSFHLVVAIPQQVILEQLPLIHRISSIIVFGAILLLGALLIFMRRSFAIPFRKVISAMRKLQDGHWDVELDQHPSSTEFEIMNKTFERMTREIHKLKIDVYEEKLKHQRAELRHLQMQINPHFFLNSLNIIYNLATVKEFALIQEMAKCLVSYFRYMFRSNSYFVPLRDELTHTANYCRIQELRLPGKLTYAIGQVDESLARVEVPPLMIHTIVENVMKHALNMDGITHIEVSVEERKEQNQDSRIVIRIRDNGPGFPEPVLSRLKDGTWSQGEGEQVGIWNVKKRLGILYQDQASISFCNHPQGGAVVEISIPIHSDKELEPHVQRAVG
jgi:two-component system sensor histidine kinase YesM